MPQRNFTLADGVLITSDGTEIINHGSRLDRGAISELTIDDYVAHPVPGVLNTTDFHAPLLYVSDSDWITIQQLKEEFKEPEITDGEEFDPCSSEELNEFLGL